MTNTNCAAKVRECTRLESPSPRPSPSLTRGERAGSGGILHAQEFVNSGSAAEAFEGCFVNPITRYGEAEALTTEQVFIGQQMPETEIRSWLDNCRR